MRGDTGEGSGLLSGGAGCLLLFVASAPTKPKKHHLLYPQKKREADQPRWKKVCFRCGARGGEKKKSENVSY